MEKSLAKYPEKNETCLHNEHLRMEQSPMNETYLPPMHLQSPE